MKRLLWWWWQAATHEPRAPLVDERGPSMTTMAMAMRAFDDRGSLVGTGGCSREIPANSNHRWLKVDLVEVVVDAEIDGRLRNQQATKEQRTAPPSLNQPLPHSHEHLPRCRTRKPIITSMSMNLSASTQIYFGSEASRITRICSCDRRKASSSVAERRARDRQRGATRLCNDVTP